jgi:hypothetical protein
MSVHADLYTALAIMFGDRVFMHSHPAFLAIVTIEALKSSQKRVFLIQKNEEGAPGYLYDSVADIVAHIANVMNEKI